MTETAEQKLGSVSSLIALVAGALGASIEAVSFIAFFVRRDLYPAQAPGGLVVADGLVTFLALLGAGLMIKNPRVGSISLAVAGVMSILSDMVGLSTVPRIIPWGLMILGAVITFATQKDEAKGPEASSSAEPEELKQPEAPPADLPNWMPFMINLALGLHVVGGGFIGLGAGLVAPPLGVLAGWLIWAAVLYGGIRLRKTKPWLALATPFVGIGAWFLLLTAGGAFLGWSA
jgi:hypothetical protein